jgi:hypothetical protein
MRGALQKAGLHAGLLRVGDAVQGVVRETLHVEEEEAIHVGVVSHFRHRVCDGKFKRHCREKQRDDGIYTVEEVAVILLHV